MVYITLYAFKMQLHISNQNKRWLLTLLLILVAVIVLLVVELDNCTYIIGYSVFPPLTVYWKSSSGSTEKIKS